jgi:hemoglobin-like flavoprotein
MLTQEHIHTAKQAVSKISDLNDIAEKFYDRLFSQSPELRKMFGEDMRDQAQKLAAILQVAFDNLDHVDSLVPTLEDMGAKHSTYGVTPEHYGLVAAALIGTISTELGDAFDERAAESFEAVLGTVANVMISGSMKAA